MQVSEHLNTNNKVDGTTTFPGAARAVRAGGRHLVPQSCSAAAPQKQPRGNTEYLSALEETSDRGRCRS